jgi:hypothetical protein
MIALGRIPGAGGARARLHRGGAASGGDSNTPGVKGGNQSIGGATNVSITIVAHSNYPQVGVIVQVA